MEDEFLVHLSELTFAQYKLMADEFSHQLEPHGGAREPGSDASPAGSGGGVAMWPRGPVGVEARGGSGSQMASQII